LTGWQAAWFTFPMTRTEALDRIDTLREALNDRDAENGLLVSIIRDLWDEYPIADAKDAARRLLLSDYEAEQQIKVIVAAITE
jgi:hypothetical protein